MHLRCVCVLLLVGVNITWAGLTRELSSCFLLVNFKISEGHNTVLACDISDFLPFLIVFNPCKNPSKDQEGLLCSIAISSNLL